MSRVALVTGGARGIGRATAQRLVGAGMRVAVGDLDTPDVAGTLGLQLDVTDRASFAAFADAAERELGPVDVLVNNAGIMHVGAFLEEDDPATERMLGVNVRGVLNGMKEVLPRMVERGAGHLVNVASTAGRVGYPGGATYCGTKFFVVGLSEAVRQELRGTGVEVSCVMPGIVNTELTEGLPRPRGARSIEPEDVADAIVGALRRPRFDVYAPRSLGWAIGGSHAVPRRAREGLARALHWDRFLLDQDRDARGAYERRVSD